MSASTFQVERTATGTRTTPAGPRPATTTYATTTGAITNGTIATGTTTLTTTVPKELVHRSAVAEVLLTGWQRLDDTHFTLTAQWPRGHSFFTPVAGGHHDPLIGCETLRQTGILLAHAEFGVPLDHHFLLRDLDLTVVPQHLKVGYEPAALTIHITCTRIDRRGHRLSGLRFNAVFRRNGHTLATGGGSFSCISPAVYRRIRGNHTTQHTPHHPHPTTPAPPHTVGRTTPNDVVLTPTTRPTHWHLRIDTRHPILFEHHVDHVPGMVLLEAARQATTSLLNHTTPHHTPTTHLPLHITSHFHHYTELNTPCHIHAHHTTPTTTHITAHQNHTPVFHATITTNPHHT